MVEEIGALEALEPKGRELLIRKSTFCQKVTVSKDKKSPSRAILKGLHGLQNKSG